VTAGRQEEADRTLNEYMINHCYRLMLAAQTPENQRFWYARMARYVEQRSPEQVQAMEQERGLA
jgi:hypothetical protein